MKPRYWILDGHNIVGTDDVIVWSRWFENKYARRVAQDVIGEASVSMVFLGLDHSFDDDGPPLLFETMIFGGLHDQDQ